jgi:hypothetical protein
MMYPDFARRMAAVVFSGIASPVLQAPFVHTPLGEMLANIDGILIERVCTLAVGKEFNESIWRQISVLEMICQARLLTRIGKELSRRDPGCFEGLASLQREELRQFQITAGMAILESLFQRVRPFSGYRRMAHDLVQSFERIHAVTERIIVCFDSHRAGS